MLANNSCCPPLSCSGKRSFLATMLETVKHFSNHLLQLRAAHSFIKKRSFDALSHIPWAHQLNDEPGEERWNRYNSYACRTSVSLSSYGPLHVCIRRRKDGILLPKVNINSPMMFIKVDFPAPLTVMMVRNCPLLDFRGRCLLRQKSPRVGNVSLRVFVDIL